RSTLIALAKAVRLWNAGDVAHHIAVLRSTAGYVPSLPSGLVHRLGLILRPIPPLAEATVVAISLACGENLHSDGSHENRRRSVHENYQSPRAASGSTNRHAVRPVRIDSGGEESIGY